MAKQQKKTMTTPKAPCKWPWLSRPNTKFKEEGEYSVTLLFKEDDPFIAKLTEMAEQAFEEATAAMKPAMAKRATLVLPCKPEMDAEGEETGMLEVRFKTNASRIDKKTQKVIKMKPRVFDAKNQMVKADLAIGNDSILNVNFSPVPQVVRGKVYLSLYLNAVRVVELVEFSPDGSAMFGEEEEGFEADEFDAGSSVDGEDDIEDGEEF